MERLDDEKLLEAEGIDVFINVYDLLAENDYVYSLGLGVYHTGVVLMNKEIAYGFSPLPLSGIYAVEPGTAPFLRLRERNLPVGKTRIGLHDLKDIVIELGKSYTGDSYDLLEKNCNHFASEFVEILTGRPLPSWINRLAFLSLSLKCLIPAKYLPQIHRVEAEGEVGEAVPENALVPLDEEGHVCPKGSADSMRFLN